LVQLFKQSDPTASIKQLILNPKEFDERDEIIMEKDSEIKKLSHTKDIYDQVQVDLTRKNLLLKEYEDEISMLREIKESNDISDFIEAEN